MTQLATRPNGNALAINGFEREQIDLIKKTVAPDATDLELKLFLHTCQTRGLDPLLKQVYFIKRGGKGTIQVSIDGFRTKAAETGEYAGSDDAVFEMNGNLPASASVTVWRIVQGIRCPFTATARWSEYAQYYGNRLADLWQKMPHTMLAKCAESLALRKAFPAQLGGLYTNEEMQQAGSTPTYVDTSTGEVLDRTPVQPRRPKDPDPDAMKHERLDGEKVHAQPIDPATQRPAAAQYRTDEDRQDFAPRSTEEDAVLGKHLAWLGGWMVNKKMNKDDRDLAIYLLNMAAGCNDAEQAWTSRKELSEEDWAACKKALIGVKNTTLNAWVQAYVERKHDDGTSPFSDEHVPPGIEPCPACKRADLNCLCTPEEVTEARAMREAEAVTGVLMDVEPAPQKVGAFTH